MYIDAYEPEWFEEARNAVHISLSRIACHKQSVRNSSSKESIGQKSRKCEGKAGHENA